MYFAGLKVPGPSKQWCKTLPQTEAPLYLAIPTPHFDSAAFSGCGWEVLVSVWQLLDWWLIAIVLLLPFWPRLTVLRDFLNEGCGGINLGEQHPQRESTFTAAFQGFGSVFSA